MLLSMRAVEFLPIINVKCFVLSIDWIISGFLALKCFILFLLLVSGFFSFLLPYFGFGL